LKYVGASMYRVIFDKLVSDTEGSYVGVVYHPGRGEGGAFAACTEDAAPACPVTPTTRTRDLWDMMRRAVGKKPTKKPTKTPANCKKPKAKKPTTKKPTTKKPTKKPATKKPKAKRPTTKRPTTKKPKKGGKV
jgi:cell division septation protein DedD